MNSANRVAVNTLIQFVQLIANVLIGLISVRLILSALGEVDYGVYDLIGGIIGLLSFISDSISQSSMRFLSVSIGKKDRQGIILTFRSCFWLHLFVAIVLAALIEFIGLFLFNGYLNIPSERVFSARLVYHCVTLSLLLNIIVSPFKALIQVHEHFWYTSLVSFINSLLKLLIAILISVFFVDKLIAYAFLLAFVTLLDFVLLALFPCFRYPQELSLSFPGIKALTSITSFVGWTLLDVLGSVLNRQGYAVLLNRFFGPVSNTSFALSRQLEGNIFTVSSSAINTMKPQIMKSYGAGDESRMFRLSMTAGKIGFFLMSIVSIPLIIMMPDFLNLWLKSYPKDTVVFSQMLVLACMFEQLTRGLVFANQSIGNIKWFSIIVSSIRISALPISWFCLRLGCSASTAILVFLICETIASFSRVVVLSRISNYNPIDFVHQVVVRIVPPVTITFALCFALYLVLPHSILFLSFIFVITASLFLTLILFLGLTTEEKVSIREIKSSILSKLCFHQNK